MWEKLRVVFTIPELRKKILLTLGLLGIYRIGWHIPLPIIDQAKIADQTSFPDETHRGTVYVVAPMDDSRLKRDRLLLFDARVGNYS